MVGSELFETGNSLNESLSQTMRSVLEVKTMP